MLVCWLACRGILHGLVSKSEHGARYSVSKEGVERRHKDVLVCKRVECELRDPAAAAPMDVDGATGGSAGGGHGSGSGGSGSAVPTGGTTLNGDGTETVVGLELHEGDAQMFLESIHGRRTAAERQRCAGGQQASGVAAAHMPANTGAYG